MPSFNLKGEATVTTISGGITTLLIMVLTIIYASLKLVVLINKEDSYIGYSEELAYFSSNDILNLNNIGFRMAFRVYIYLDFKSMHDQR